MQKAFYKLLRNSKTGFSFFKNGLKTYSAVTKGHLMPWSGYVATSSHCEPPRRISTLSDLDMLPTTMASWLPKVMCPPPCCYEINFKVIYTHHGDVKAYVFTRLNDLSGLWPKTEILFATDTKSPVVKYFCLCGCWSMEHWNPSSPYLLHDDKTLVVFQQNRKGQICLSNRSTHHSAKRGTFSCQSSDGRTPEGSSLRACPAAGLGCQTHRQSTREPRPERQYGKTKVSPCIPIFSIFLKIPGELALCYLKFWICSK